MPPSRAPFRFGLSPSLGLVRTQLLARRMEATLAPALGAAVEVSVAGSYEHLEAMLIGGGLDAAWVNPLLLARLHAAGATASLRGVRHGSTSFLSALVGRADAAIDLGQASDLRAAWTDPDSLAGYRLPMLFLRGNGLLPERLFSTERFTFSYPTALGHVLEGRADVAACFVHRADRAALDAVLRQMVGIDAERLAPLAFTDPVPNDGVVFAPHLRRNDAARLCTQVEALLRADAGKPLLEMFDVEAVIRSGPGDEEALHELAAHGGQRFGP